MEQQLEHLQTNWTYTVQVPTQKKVVIKPSNL